MLRPYVNFTALTERRAAKGNYNALFGNRVPHVSDLEVGYGLNFAHPGIGFEADLRFTYMGHYYEGVYDWPTSTSYSARGGGKTTADLFLSQRIHSSDKGTFSAFGEVRNMFNERYTLIHGYPMPGRSFFAGLRYDF
jgi:vitamin B12 transporter